MTSEPAAPDRGLADVLSRLIATVFGCGYAPLAPGTVGSAAGIISALAIESSFGWQPWKFGVLAALAAAPAIWAADRFALRVRAKDPGLVVIDEVLGQWVTLSGATSFNWKSVAAAFFLFRLLDVIKPPPVNVLEKLPGGAGIVADDLAAGLYGALVLFAAGCFNLY